MKASLFSTLTLSSSLVFAPAMALANDNPFSANALDSGYQLAQADTKAQEGKCGEGKCGAKSAKKETKEGKCGEGKCGAKSEKKETKEGKCGEGKCGG